MTPAGADATCRWGARVALGLLLIPSQSAARADYRPQDRFFFALSAGAALGRSQALSLSTASATAAAQRQSQVGALAGFETSYWPWDYTGLGLSVAVLGTPSPSTQHAAWTSQLGLFAVVAVPLRVVQPYAGVWGGMRHTTLAGQGSAIEPSVQPLAGVNIYLTRNLRAFVQWQYAPLDFEARAADTQITYRGVSAQLLSSGLRWSPHFFHAARPAMKVDLIWWSTLAAAAVFATAAWLGTQSEGASP